jgi:hypothetical protein
MSQNNEPFLDVDLTPRFHWRWNEHGIHLGVCAIIGLLVLGLYRLPRTPKPPMGPTVVEVIQVRYVATSDEPAERDDPFRDTRLIRPYKKTPERQGHRAM